MSIQIVIEHGQACPKLICEQCKRPINDAALANVVWDEPIESFNVESKSYTPLFMHKDCDRGPDKHSCWQPLDHFLVYLEHNIKMTPSKRKDSEHYANVFANL